MASLPMKILCVGVGNTFRCDDGAGIYIVRKLKKEFSKLSPKLSPQQCAHISFLESSGEGSGPMDSWRGFDHVVLFDAVMKQGTPGTVIHLLAQNEKFPSDFFKYSSHAFSLAEAVELARVLDVLPEKVEVYGVEGQTFGYGEVLSSEVLQGCDEIVQRFVQDQCSPVARVHNEV